MEVLDDTGTVKSDTDFVLNKWKTSFSNLYNASDQDIFLSDTSTDVVNNEFVQEFEEEFSIFEILKAVFNAKKIKHVA